MVVRITMKRNRTIDLLRFVLSLLIIPIHADLFIDISKPVFQCFSLGFVRVGVPFFFIASGFFFREGIDRPKKYFKYLKLWLIFILLDLALTGWYYYPKFPNALAFFHKAVFAGISDAYWFIPTLIITQIILEPVFKKGNFYPAIAIGLIMYLFSMTHDSYSFLFEGTWIYSLSELHTEFFIFPQCGLVESVFFLSIGGLISKEKERIAYLLKGKSRILVFSIFLFSLLLMGEAYFTNNHGSYDGNCYLSLIVLPVLLFVWALVEDPVTFPTRRLGEMSLYVYLVHPILVNIIRIMGAGSLVRTLGSAVLSVAISYLITKVSASKR